jgi:hypothetical protein
VTSDKILKHAAVDRLAMEVDAMILEELSD